MKAKDFIAEMFLKEFKFLDRLKAGDNLQVAVKVFIRMRDQYNDPYEAMIKAAQMTGVRPRVLQTYLKDNNLLETEMNLNESYIGFELSDQSRQQLATIFEPKYPEWIGHHITYSMNSKLDLPEQPNTVEVVGYVDNGESLEALIVEINGSPTRDIDNGTYHITWSLDRDQGAKPFHSNKLIADQRYKKVGPYAIEVTPKILG